MGSDEGNGEQPVIRTYPHPSFLREVAGWATISFFTASLVFIPVGSVLALYRAVTRPFPWAFVVSALLGLSVCPHRKWHSWEVAWCKVLELWCEIFHVTAIYEPGLLSASHNGQRGPLRHFILTVHPHGVIPITGFLIWGSTLTHGLHPDGFGGSGAALAMPFFRQFLIWMGGHDASKHVVKKQLQVLQSFSIFSGGISEMMATHNDKETLLLSKRTGIISLAKEYKKNIVPVLALGTTQHFKRWPDPDNAVLRKLSSRIRAALLVPYGRFGLPIPLFAKTTLIYGTPINPDALTVEEAHKQWMDWYTKAYARYAEAAGVSDRELVIL